MPGPMQWMRKSLSGFSDWYARNGFNRIASLRADSGPSWSGERVTEAAALNLSVVWACRRRISESIAFLPLQLMREAGDKKVPMVDHPMYRALKNAPNSEMTAMSFRESLSGHTLMLGNCFAQISRRSGTEEAYELWPLMPWQVRMDRERTGEKRLVYLVKDSNAAEKSFTVQRNKAQDILHVPGLSEDGINGFSVLQMARQSWGTALATERNVGRFHANGGRVPYVLTMEGKFKTDQDFEKFRADWEKTYSEPNRAPMIEPPVKEYKQIGLSMADSQMLESRQFSVPEICRWFLLSPHLVGDLSNANNSITEQLALEYVNLTLMPWLKRWEENLWRCVLTPDEKSRGYFFKHNVNALLRGDFLTRMQGYATALQNGWLNQNEVRGYEDLDGFEGGDGYHIQLNMQTLPGGTPTASQQSALTKLGTAQKKGWLQ